MPTLFPPACEVSMAASAATKPSVCRYPFTVEGRPAFYVIDWHGVRSELRIVEEDETEDEVIQHLSDALWAVRPRGASEVEAPDQRRPRLRLL